MWTVSVKAGQSELNEARVTPKHTNTRRPSHDLLKFIYTVYRYPGTTAHIFFHVTPFSLAIWWRMIKLVILVYFNTLVPFFRIAIKPQNILRVMLACNQYDTSRLVTPMLWLAWMRCYFTFISYIHTYISSSTLVGCSPFRRSVLV